MDWRKCRLLTESVGKVQMRNMCDRGNEGKVRELGGSNNNNKKQTNLTPTILHDVIWETLILIIACVGIVIYLQSELALFYKSAHFVLKEICSVCVLFPLPDLKQEQTLLIFVN
jgi:hypothetical protein